MTWTNSRIKQTGKSMHRKHSSNLAQKRQGQCLEQVRLPAMEITGNPIFTHVVLQLLVKCLVGRWLATWVPRSVVFCIARALLTLFLGHSSGAKLESL